MRTEIDASRTAEWASRAAWLLAFVVPLALALLLLSASRAEAAAGAPARVALAGPDLAGEEWPAEEELEELEFGEEGLLEGECELAEEELEEGLLEAEEAREICELEAELEGLEDLGEGAFESPRSGGAAPAGGGAAACPLRRVRVRASLDRGERLRLALAYATRAPARATIVVRGGGRRIATARRRLAGGGVLRLTRRVARAPRRVLVTIRISGAGRSCRGVALRRAPVR